MTLWQRVDRSTRRNTAAVHPVHEVFAARLQGVIDETVEMGAAPEGRCPWKVTRSKQHRTATMEAANLPMKGWSVFMASSSGTCLSNTTLEAGRHFAQPPLVAAMLR